GWRGTHSRAHMYRSILESIGFEMRFNLDCIEKQTGVRITALRAMGGGTRSKLWRQIMADTAGVPITTCVEDEISALGAAV
ncbi:FGGY-family carbohydrate kinase, partial [Cutibacterium acnes subsp. acnes]|nr:FGGY-family carbohydrate kinase [Cutibacterium acnes subsp. acnes]